MPAGILRNVTLDLTIKTQAGRVAMTEVDKLETLGNLVNNTGRDGEAIDFRLAKAEKHYWRHSRTLKGKGTAANRMLAWSQKCGAAALHGAGTWALNTDHLHKIQTWENKMLRKVFNRKWGSNLQAYRGESAHHFNRIRKGMGQA